MIHNTRRAHSRRILLFALVGVTIIARVVPPFVQAGPQSSNQTHHVFLDNGAYSEKVLVGSVGDAVHIENRDQYIHRIHFALPPHSDSVVQKAIVAPVCWFVNTFGDLLILLIPIILGFITLPKRAKNQPWPSYFRNSKTLWWAASTIFCVGVIQFLKQNPCGSLAESERAGRYADEVVIKLDNRDATNTAIMAATGTAAIATRTAEVTSGIDETPGAQVTNTKQPDPSPTRRSSKPMSFLGGDIEPIPPGGVVVIPCDRPGIGVIICDTCPEEDEDLVIVVEPVPATSTATNSPTYTPSSTPTLTPLVTDTATSSPYPTPPPTPPTSIPTAIPPKPTSPPASPRIDLINPAYGRSVGSGAVSFKWSLEFTGMLSGEVFEIRVCKGRGNCLPDKGIDRPGSDALEAGKVYARAANPGIPPIGGCQIGEWCTWTVVLMSENNPNSPRVTTGKSSFLWGLPPPTPGPQEKKSKDTPRPPPSPTQN